MDIEKDLVDADNILNVILEDEFYGVGDYALSKIKEDQTIQAVIVATTTMTIEIRINLSIRSSLILKSTRY